MAGHARYTALLDACVLYPIAMCDELMTRSRSLQPSRPCALDGGSGKRPPRTSPRSWKRAAFLPQHCACATRHTSY